jgi:hypothetical protein
MKTEPTPQQAEALGRRIHPMLGYLSRCRSRLDAGHYDRSGKFYALIAQAYDAMHSLSVYLHYRSITSGVGEPPYKRGPEPERPSEDQAGMP